MRESLEYSLFYLSDMKYCHLLETSPDPQLGQSSTTRPVQPLFSKHAQLYSYSSGDANVFKET